MEVGETFSYGRKLMGLHCLTNILNCANISPETMATIDFQGQTCCWFQGGYIYLPT